MKSITTATDLGLSQIGPEQPNSYLSVLHDVAYLDLLQHSTHHKLFGVDVNVSHHST